MSQICDDFYQFPMHRNIPNGVSLTKCFPYSLVKKFDAVYIYIYT